MAVKRRKLSPEPVTTDQSQAAVNQVLAVLAKRPSTLTRADMASLREAGRIMSRYIAQRKEAIRAEKRLARAARG
jgi:hypothetical protein